MDICNVNNNNKKEVIPSSTSQELWGRKKKQQLWQPFAEKDSESLTFYLD